MKTVLISLILAKIRSQKGIVLELASSGIADMLLEGGRTAHSAFKLPLNMLRNETPTCNLSRNSAMAKMLQESKFIVWDECTKAHTKIFGSVRPHVARFAKEQKPVWWCNDFIGR